MALQPNRYHGATINTDMRREDWEQCWQDGKIFFHKDHIHLFLAKHSELLLSGRTAIKIFVPLCGKSLDIRWLYDKGHTVVGVEGSEQAVKGFFVEHGIAFSSRDVPEISGTLYESADGRIRIYCCDVFNFTSCLEQGFQAVWDRASLGAINPRDRERYAALVQSVMATGCTCLIAVFNYDENQFIGPPRNVPQAALEALYGGRYSVKLLDSLDMLSDQKREQGITSFTECLFVLSQVS